MASRTPQSQPAETPPPAPLGSNPHPNKKNPAEALGKTYDRFFAAMLKFSASTVMKNPKTREMFGELYAQTTAYEARLVRFIRVAQGLEEPAESVAGPQTSDPQEASQPE